MTAAEVLAAQDAASSIKASAPLRDYVVRLLWRTREDPRVDLGASPRAGLMLLRAAKAHAMMAGRDHALPDDVQALAPAVLAHRLMLDEWIYQPGLPANAVRPNPAAFAEVDAAAAAYGTGGGVPQAAWAKWTTAERLRFMAKLPRERTAAQLGALDQALGLSNEGNDEVLFAWLQLALANRYEPAVPLAEQFRRAVAGPLLVEGPPHGAGPAGPDGVAQGETAGDHVRRHTDHPRFRRR